MVTERAGRTAAQPSVRCRASAALMTISGPASVHALYVADSLITDEIFQSLQDESANCVHALLIVLGYEVAIGEMYSPHIVQEAIGKGNDGLHNVSKSYYTCDERRTPSLLRKVSPIVSCSFIVRTPAINCYEEIGNAKYGMRRQGAPRELHK
jgi:hypothetical protein